MTDFSEKAGSAKMAFSRRGILKSGTSLLGCTLAGSTLGALSRQAFAAAAKPTSLNMLYATSEADSDAIKAALPDFKAAMGFDINLDTMPYNGGVKVTEARRHAVRRPSRERRSMPRERATRPRQQCVSACRLAS
jgi:hypothetical protein